MAYEVEVKERPELKIMSIRQIVTINSIGQDIAKSFQDIYQTVKAHGGDFTGECVAVYHTMEYDPNNIDVECGFGVREYVPEMGMIKQSKIPSGMTVSVVHKGPYETLGEAYEYILGWISENGYETYAPMYDIYLNNPEDESGALTETVWFIRKK